MSLSRSRSLSIDALYRPIPQEPETVPLDDDHAEEDTENSQPRITPSTHNVVDTKIWWIFFILGCSVLLPWNVVITAMPYFFERLAGSGIQHTFGSYLSTACTASNFIFLAHATITSKHTSPSSRTRQAIYCLVVLTFLLVVSTYFVLPAGLFFAFVLFNGAAQSAAGSYLQTAVIAVASLYGPAAVQAMMAGAGAHALLVSMSSYKAVAATLEQNAAKSQHNIDVMTSQPLMSRGSSEADDDKRQTIRVAKVNIMYEVAVAYVFLITLAVFPPITTSIMPVNPETHPLLFTSIHFLVFNIGDLLGRYVCSFPIFHVWSRKRLLGLSLSRTLFIPLFLMCNVQRPSSFTTTTPIINSDFVFMFILLLFGLSNGYVSSSCMMSAPSLEHNPRLKGNVEDVDVAATVASFFLVGGLVMGSVASFAVKGTICQCNPFRD
ncbi:Equilibrative nucleoside transporter 1 [Leucoagaricus sp. SymC.cos]|nr:Equilibrative nucleoside transporter 1 [Leucoagaricus sp. SymC.cos]